MIKIGKKLKERIEARLGKEELSANSEFIKHLIKIYNIYKNKGGVIGSFDIKPSTVEIEFAKELGFIHEVQPFVSGSGEDYLDVFSKYESNLNNVGMEDFLELTKYQNVNYFINKINNYTFNKIRNSKSDAECRRYLKEFLQRLNEL